MRMFTGMMGETKADQEISRGFPKSRGKILGVPISRVVVYWGYLMGP